jgi:hypothetical protein
MAADSSRAKVAIALTEQQEPYGRRHFAPHPRMSRVAFDPVYCPARG